MEAIGDTQQGSSWAVFTMRDNQSGHHLPNAAEPPTSDVPVANSGLQHHVHSTHKTLDPPYNECELILSLFTQEHGPVLLISAPGMYNKSHNSKPGDGSEMTRLCSHGEDRESVIFWIAACDWMGSRCAGRAYGGELLRPTVHSQRHVQP